MSIAGAWRDLMARGPDPTSSVLYQACVTAARQPVFYAALSVPDTVDGRFDMLVLHVFMVIRRLSDEQVRQNLFDTLFLDMDRSLREMGVGDMGMKRRMKPMLAGFYGRATAYEVALAAAGNTALATALLRNLYADANIPPAHVAQIATYVRASVEALAAQNEAAIAEGHVAFASLPETGHG